MYPSDFKEFALALEEHKLYSRLLQKDSATP